MAACCMQTSVAPRNGIDFLSKLVKVSASPGRSPGPVVEPAKPETSGSVLKPNAVMAPTPTVVLVSLKSTTICVELRLKTSKLTMAARSLGACDPDAAQKKFVL